MSTFRNPMPIVPTRAVVLARGLGKRMRAADATAVLDPAQAAAADAGMKAMIPIGAAGHPFLDYVLSGLAVRWSVPGVVAWPGPLEDV